PTRVTIVWSTGGVCRGGGGLVEAEYVGEPLLEGRGGGGRGALGEELAQLLEQARLLAEDVVALVGVGAHVVELEVVAVVDQLPAALDDGGDAARVGAI